MTIRRRLRDLIARFGSYKPAPTSSAPRARRSAVPPELLTDALLEDMKVRGVFVGDRLREFESSVPRLDTGRGDDAMDVDGPDPSVLSARGHEALMLALRHRYEARATAKDVRVSVAGAGTLLVPGWIRERVADVLFETGDEDEPSIVEAVLTAVLKVRCLSDVDLA